MRTTGLISTSGQLNRWLIVQGPSEVPTRADVPETIARVLVRAGHVVNLLREVLPVDANDVQVLA